MAVEEAGVGWSHLLGKLFAFDVSGAVQSTDSIYKDLKDVCVVLSSSKDTILGAAASDVEQKFFSQLLALLAHCIVSLYSNNGSQVFRQTIGIPMGSDPAPFFANLFLFWYEKRWIEQQKKSNNVIARKFGKVFRFIDDLNAINDVGAFEQHYCEIYPPEFELKKENEGTQHASFLDLDISLDHGIFETNLYDKRNSFGFDITQMPFKRSNIPSKMFYDSVGAEFLRISRATSKLRDLCLSSRQLIKLMINQGGLIDQLKLTLLKTIGNHHDVYEKYHCPARSLVS